MSDRTREDEIPISPKPESPVPEIFSSKKIFFLNSSYSEGRRSEIPHIETEYCPRDEVSRRLFQPSNESCDCDCSSDGCMGCLRRNKQCFFKFFVLALGISLILLLFGSLSYNLTQNKASNDSLESEGTEWVSHYHEYDAPKKKNPPNNNKTSESLLDLPVPVYEHTEDYDSGEDLQKLQYQVEENDIEPLSSPPLNIQKEDSHEEIIYDRREPDRIKRSLSTNSNKYNEKVERPKRDAEPVHESLFEELNEVEEGMEKFWESYFKTGKTVFEPFSLTTPAYSTPLDSDESSVEEEIEHELENRFLSQGKDKNWSGVDTIATSISDETGPAGTEGTTLMEAAEFTQTMSSKDEVGTVGTTEATEGTTAGESTAKEGSPEETTARDEVDQEENRANGEEFKTWPLIHFSVPFPGVFGSTQQDQISTEQSTSEAVRGISLADAKKIKKERRKQMLINSRVVGGSSDIRLPTGPDISKPFVNTFETLKTNQQLSFTPSAASQFVLPYQMCLFAGAFPGQRSPPIHSPQPRTLFGHPPYIPSIFDRNYPQKNPFPTQQNFLSFSINNYPNAPPPRQPSQPSGGSVLTFPQQFPWQKQPIFCTYLQPPLVQFPTVPGTADFSHAKCVDCEDEPQKPLLKESLFPSGRETLCSEDKVSCMDGSCVLLENWCDNRVHCKDASDEAFCSCRERLSGDRICDGYVDCPHGEDETGCFDCPKSAFSCDSVISPESCIPLSKRCDGVRDCPTGADEIDCSGLFFHVRQNDSYHVSQSIGYLHRNWKGDWFPVCVELEESVWAEEACLGELGVLSPGLEVRFASVSPTYRGPFIVRKEDGTPALQDHCKGHVSTFVKCPPMTCGTRIEHPHPQNGYLRSVRDDTEEERAKRAETGRVVGGRESEPRAWPAAIAVYKNGAFHCGGVILDENWVLTAAHCMEQYWKHYYEIRGGMLRRFSFSAMEQTRTVSHVIIHENYDQTIMSNDLALLRLEQPFHFNRWVRPACLPTLEGGMYKFVSGPAPGTRCTAVGWGALRERGTDPDQLREVEIPIMDRCKHKEDLVGEEICAGKLEGGKDTCQGDSGGPLLCRDSSNPSTWYVAGIVSHGEGCARPGEPGAYTRISLFVDWIAANTNDFLLPSVKPLKRCPGFRCTSASRLCIPRKWVCNGYTDCLEAEDEKNCTSESTASSIFNRQYSNEYKYFEAENSEVTLLPPISEPSWDKNRKKVENPKKTSSQPVDIAKSQEVTKAQTVTFTSTTAKSEVEQLVLKADGSTEITEKEEVGGKSKIQPPADAMTTPTETETDGSLKTTEITEVRTEGLQNSSSENKNTEKFFSKEGRKTTRSVTTEKFSYEEPNRMMTSSPISTTVDIEQEDFMLETSERSTKSLESTEITMESLPEYKNDYSKWFRLGETTAGLTTDAEFEGTSPSMVTTSAGIETEVFIQKTEENITERNREMKALVTTEGLPKIIPIAESAKSTTEIVADEEREIESIREDFGKVNNKTEEISKEEKGNEENDGVSDEGNDTKEEDMDNTRETTVNDKEEEEETSEKENQSVTDVYDDSKSLETTADMHVTEESKKEQEEEKESSEEKNDTNEDDDRTEEPQRTPNTTEENSYEENEEEVDQTEEESEEENDKEIEVVTTKNLPSILPDGSTKTEDSVTGTTEGVISRISKETEGFSSGGSETGTEATAEDIQREFEILDSTGLPSTTLETPGKKFWTQTEDPIALYLGTNSTPVTSEELFPSSSSPSTPPTSRRNSKQDSEYFQCRLIVQSILSKYRCDGIDDCEDGTDEENCYCADTLQKLNPKLICDGRVDCPDRSDEKNCSKCQEGEFRCSSSNKCIPAAKRCDGTFDCKFEEDEAKCLALAKTGEVDVEGEPPLETEGVLVTNREGVWTVKCQEGTSAFTAGDAIEVCTVLGTIGYERYENRSLSHCTAFHVTCSKMLMNSVRRYQRKNSTYLWPWNAFVYSDGRPLCSAVLLQPRWLLTSSHCLQNVLFEKHYLAAELGATDFTLKSKNAKTIRIDGARVISDIALLHLSEEVKQTESVRFLGFPYTFDSNSRKDVCIAVGDRTLFLRSTDNCPEASRCFKKISSTPSGCRSPPWVGVIVCQSRFGWYPSAVYSERSGYCGFDNVRLTNLQENLKALFRVLDEDVNVYPTPTCYGFRCSQGLCVPPSQKCNGWSDCPSGEDESLELCKMRREIKDCKVTELKCRNGRCIPKVMFGDGKDDCGDESDEPWNKTCAEYLRLTAPKRICDGRRNCFDKTDEDYRLCPCDGRKFQCKLSGYCIPKDFVCDGQKDCPGGEDEGQCLGRKLVKNHAKSHLEIMQKSYGIWHAVCPNRLSKDRADALCKDVGFKEASHVFEGNQTIVSPEVDAFSWVKLNWKTSVALRGNRPFVRLVTTKRTCGSVKCA